MNNFKEVRKDLLTYRNTFQKLDRLGNHIGARPISINESECVYEYLPDTNHFNPNGMLHGGALFTVMDSSQGLFIHYILDEKFTHAVTGTATIRYEAPVSESPVTVRTVLDRIEGRKYFIRSVATQNSKTVATLNEIWIAISKPVNHMIPFS